VSIRWNKKGRGVYAEKAYKKGETVERCQVIYLPAREIRWPEILHFYAYKWDDRWSIVLGNGMLYNHADDPNLYAHRDGRVVRFRARRAIRKGEELLIDYGVPDHFLPEHRARFARGSAPGCFARRR
jgi:hypothetical protein